MLFFLPRERDVRPGVEPRKNGSMVMGITFRAAPLSTSTRETGQPSMCTVMYKGVEVLVSHLASQKQSFQTERALGSYLVALIQKKFLGAPCQAWFYGLSSSFLCLLFKKSSLAWKIKGKTRDLLKGTESGNKTLLSTIRIPIQL